MAMGSDNYQRTDYNKTGSTIASTGGKSMGMGNMGDTGNMPDMGNMPGMSNMPGHDMGSMGGHGAGGKQN